MTISLNLPPDIYPVGIGIWAPVADGAHQAGNLTSLSIATSAADSVNVA